MSKNTSNVLMIYLKLLYIDHVHCNSHVIYFLASIRDLCSLAMYYLGVKYGLTRATTSLTKTAAMKVGTTKSIFYYIIVLHHHYIRADSQLHACASCNHV